MKVRSKKAIEKRTGKLKGVKYDQGKLQWHLFPFKAAGEIVKVLMHGARKYSPDNWQYVDDFENRYFDAAMRHMTDYLAGKRHDKDSGLLILAHAACDLLFLIWKEMQKEKENGIQDYHSGCDRTE